MRSKIIKKAHKRDDFKLTSHNFLLCIRSGYQMIQKDGVDIEMLPDDCKRTGHVI